MSSVTPFAALSFPWALLPAMGATVLLRRLADQRMYEAKRQIPLNF